MIIIFFANDFIELGAGLRRVILSARLPLLSLAPVPEALRWLDGCANGSGVLIGSQAAAHLQGSIKAIPWFFSVDCQFVPLPVNVRSFLSTHPSFKIIILDADGLQEARALMEQDPRLKIITVSSSTVCEGRWFFSQKRQPETAGREILKAVRRALEAIQNARKTTQCIITTAVLGHVRRKEAEILAAIHEPDRYLFRLTLSHLDVRLTPLWRIDESGLSVTNMDDRTVLALSPKAEGATLTSSISRALHLRRGSMLAMIGDVWFMVLTGPTTLDTEDSDRLVSFTMRDSLFAGYFYLIAIL